MKINLLNTLEGLKLCSDEDFEQTFSAYREFDSNQMLQTVQEELFGEIVEEISDLVYNATVANW